MAAKTKICSVGDTPKYYFRGSAVLYTTENAGVTGITPADADVKAATTPLYDTAELMRTGKLLRLKVRCRTGSGKTVSYDLFIAREKSEAAFSNYNDKGKTLNGNTVLSANFGRRQVMK